MELKGQKEMETTSSSSLTDISSSSPIVTDTTNSTTVTSLAGEEGENEARIFSRRAAGLGDVSDLAVGVGTAQVFEKWLTEVRKRREKYRFSGSSNRHTKYESMTFGGLHSFSSSPSWFSAADHFDGACAGGSENDNLECPLSSDRSPEVSLWERLGNAATIDIESNDFCWNMLSSLHRTEHSSSTEQSEDEFSKALEVTVNSGGVVFFALFNTSKNNVLTKESVAVIKFASSRMATQSEHLGYEFAKWLGVQTPQGRVIHNTSLEWQEIKDATEKIRDIAMISGDEIGEMTCSELLEALELSRCFFLMNYVHGSPLLETLNIFDSRDVTEKSAAFLGRILMLDLVIRNEDRLPCRQLGWRGNPANLLFTYKGVANMNAEDATMEFDSRRLQVRLLKDLRKERRANSVDGQVGTSKPDLTFDNSDMPDGNKFVQSMEQLLDKAKSGDFHIVAIDSGVPRRPPAGKRSKDQSTYPKLVELMLNSAIYSSNLLFELTVGKIGVPALEDVDDSTIVSSNFKEAELASIVHEFRGGFRAALRDLQGFHLFLLTLYQKLDGLLRLLLSIINKSSGEVEKDEDGMSEIPMQPIGSGFNSTPIGKDRSLAESSTDFGDFESRKTTHRSLHQKLRDNPEMSSPMSRENWSGRSSKGSGEHRNMRLTTKIRDFNKIAKMDAELSNELEQWNEMLKTDVIKLCQDNNFNTGFFEGSDSNITIDAYELKVRLEHILERISLISNATNTEKPSRIMDHLFIGGALSARSVHTLEHLGITNILCLCSNEIGQSESQNPDLFEYKNISINDTEDAEISNLFDDACDFIDRVDKSGRKVLVHCFEGRSRSATVVLAYLMLKKNLTLSKAWNMLKKVHRRAHPNEGFSKTLSELDKKLYGKASMDWQNKRPVMMVCPICGKNVGLSSSSLKLHLQKSHRKISSGSVDSAMTIEIQRALDSLKITRSGSISPNRKQC